MKRLIHSITAIAILALPTAAMAADHEISLELGTTGHGADDNWFLFNDDWDTLSSYGVRAGFAVHDNVSVIGGWHHGARGTRLELNGTDESEANAGLAYYADTFSLGAKVDWPLWVWLHPYATVQGLGIRSMVRIDDAPADDDNPNQIQRGAFSPAGAATGGLEFRVPFHHNEWALASHLELGYQLGTRSSFDELGSLTNRGVVFRWGLGVRF
jgi:hypothetical protein